MRTTRLESHFGRPLPERRHRGLGAIFIRSEVLDNIVPEDTKFGSGPWKGRLVPENSIKVRVTWGGPRLDTMSAWIPVDYPPWLLAMTGVNKWHGRIPIGAEVRVGFYGDDGGMNFNDPFIDAILALPGVRSGQEPNDTEGKLLFFELFGYQFLIDAHDAVKKFHIQTPKAQTIRFTDLDDQEKVELIDKAGQKVLLDATSGSERILLVDKAGQQVLLSASAGAEKIQALDKAGQQVIMDAVANKIAVTATEKVVLTAPTQIELNDNTDRVVIWNALKSYIDAHVNPVTVDPNTHSGTSTAPTVGLPTSARAAKVRAGP